MIRSLLVPPPRDTPGPDDPAGGDFVLLDPTVAPDTPAATELADGSDVHDVNELGRQVDAAALEEVLRAYLDDEPEPPPVREPDHDDR